jgi:hypothetical protein
MTKNTAPRQVWVAHSLFIERSHTTKNTAFGYCCLASKWHLKPFTLIAVEYKLNHVVVQWGLDLPLAFSPFFKIN